MRTLGLGLLAFATAAPATPIGQAKAIDQAAAQAITDACTALARTSGWKVHVTVLNGYGDLMRFVGMDGATRTSGVLSQGKARTVFRTGRATRDVAKMDPSAQAAFDAVALTGGLPVTVDGRMVGAVAVSGAQPDDDERCAKAGIDAAM